MWSTTKILDYPKNLNFLSGTDMVQKREAGVKIHSKKKYKKVSMVIFGKEKRLGWGYMLHDDDTTTGLQTNQKKNSKQTQDSPMTRQS